TVFLSGVVVCRINAEPDHVLRVLLVSVLHRLLVMPAMAHRAVGIEPFEHDDLPLELREAEGFSVGVLQHEIGRLLPDLGAAECTRTVLVVASMRPCWFGGCLR